MTRRRSADPKLPSAKPKVRRRKEKRYENDRDKWLIPSATTTLEVALPNELIAEVDAVIGIVYPALRDRSDFAYEACRYAIESWQEGISTPEGKKLVALAQKKRRLARRKRAAKKKDII